MKKLNMLILLISLFCCSQAKEKIDTVTSQINIITMKIIDINDKLYLLENGRKSKSRLVYIDSLKKELNTAENEKKILLKLKKNDVDYKQIQQSVIK